MRIRASWVAFTALASLQGCGGGGDDAPPPPPPTYSVGGAVSGLVGSGLVLTLNGASDLAVGISGNFAFSTALTSSTGYTVAVRTQPVTPHQTCVVTNASGTVGSSAVTNVSVACTTNTYSVSGTVTGLAATGLVLRLNGAGDLPVGANGSFAFPNPLASGSNYAVTIRTQPTGPFQTCVATGGSGVIGGSDTSVSVNCTTDMFSVGGTVTGLTGSDLVLQLNGGQDLIVGNNGAFAFPNRLLRGTQYTVTVAAETSTYRELCALNRASGTGAATDITSVGVECAVVSGFVYKSGADGLVWKYGIKPTTGALLPIGIAAGVGDYISRLVVAPNRATLYVVSLTASLIHAFSIEPSKGDLNPIGEPASTGDGIWGDQTVAHPSGNFLYVFNIGAGTVNLISVDPSTGALESEGVVATATGAASYSGREHLAITPDGAYLYVLDHVYGVPDPSLTTYSIDAATGHLTPQATIAPGDLRGITMDSLGRFVYLRKTNIAQDVASASTTVVPFAIDPATGVLTPGDPTTTDATNNGSYMVVDPSGRYAYLLGTFNYLPEHDRIDAFSIDPSTGTLTGNGAGVLTAGVGAGMAMDSTGRFLFAGNEKPAGTWDTSRISCDGSTFAISGAGPSEGQISAAGPGCSIGTSASPGIAVVD